MQKECVLIATISMEERKGHQDVLMKNCMLKVSVRIVTSIYTTIKKDKEMKK